MIKAHAVDTAVVPFDRSTDSTPDNWTHGLPVLSGQQVVLRELRPSDAASLVELISTDDVSRFISHPPKTPEGFERFIAAAARQRRAGTAACYAVTLKGFDTAIGLIQFREIEGPLQVGEWGFAIGAPFWGTGLFQEAATLFLDFVFHGLGVHRLEARVAARNGRGNSALRRLGAVEEGLLRKALRRNGEYLDQVLFAIVEDDWRASMTERLHAQTAQVH
jgi:ribosomal-protein-alanine N-acetyltransferase